MLTSTHSLHCAASSIDNRYYRVRYANDINAADMLARVHAALAELYTAIVSMRHRYAKQLTAMYPSVSDIQIHETPIYSWHTAYNCGKNKGIFIRLRDETGEVTDDCDKIMRIALHEFAHSIQATYEHDHDSEFDAIEQCLLDLASNRSICRRNRIITS
jgi:hypothetical protein